jgi:large repetitive protein
MLHLLRRGILLLCFFFLTHSTYAQCPAQPPPTFEGPLTVSTGTVSYYNLKGGDYFNSTWSVNGGGMINYVESTRNFIRIDWGNVPGDYRLVITPINSCRTQYSAFTKTIRVISGALTSAPGLTGASALCLKKPTTFSVPVVPGKTVVWGYGSAYALGTVSTVASTVNNEYTITLDAGPTSSFYPPYGNTTPLVYVFAAYTDGQVTGNYSYLKLPLSDHVIPPTVNGELTACVNSTVAYRNKYPRLGETEGWSVSGGGTIDQLGNVTWMQQGGPYQVNLTISNSCYTETVTTTLSVTVGAQKLPTPTNLKASNSFLCMNRDEPFTCDAVPGATSYTFSAIRFIETNPMVTNTSTTNFGKLTFTSRETYKILAQASNGSCLSDPVTITKNIAPLQTSPQAITGPTSACINSTITLATPFLEGNTYKWTTNGEIVGSPSGATIQIRWPTTGTKTAFVQAITPCGDVSPAPVTSDYYTINVHDQTLKINDILGATKACVASYYYTLGYENTTISTVNWSISPSGGGVISAAPAPSAPYANIGTNVTWSTPGTYTLTAVATNACGVTAAKSLTVNVVSGTKPPFFKPTLAGSLNPCINSNVTYQLINATTSPPQFWYDWKLPTGGTIFPANNTATVNWIEPGSHFLYIIPSNSQCMGDGFGTKAIVLAVPDLALDPLSVCAGVSSTQLTYSSNLGSASNSMIDWNAEANAAGLVDDTSWKPLGANVPISQVPRQAGIYAGQLFLKNLGCTNGIGKQITLTVNPLPTISTVQPVICAGTTSTNIAYSSLNTPDQYKIDWYDARIADFNYVALPQNLFNVSNIPAELGQFNGTIFVKNTATGCESQSKVVSFVVIDYPSISVTNAPQVCSGNSTVTFPFSDKKNADRYRIDWDNNANTEGLLDVSGLAIPTNTIQVTNIPSKPGTYQGTLYVKDSRANCESPGSPISFIVKPLPSLAFDEELKVCNGFTSASFPYTRLNGADYYQLDWDAASNTAGLVDVVTYTTLPTPLKIFNIPTMAGIYSGTLKSKEISYTNCQGTQAITLTVTAVPSLTITETPSICSGTTTANVPYGNVLARPDQYRIDWNASANAAGLANVSPTTFTNTGSISISGIPLAANTYSGSLYLKDTNGPCESAGIPISVIVKPNPVAYGSNQSICSGSDTNVLLETTISGSTPSWTASSSSNIIGASAASGSVINQTLTDTNGSGGTVTYTVVATANECTGPAKQIIVTVKPTANVIANDKTICTSTSTDLLLSSRLSNATFKYVVKSAVNTTGASAGSANPIAQNLSNATTSIGQVVYTVTPSGNQCPSESSDITVTVNPLPQITNNTKTISACSGQPFTIAPTSNIAASTFSWSASVTLGIVSGFVSSGTGAPSATLTNHGTSSATIKYTITPGLGDCDGASADFIVTLKPTSTASIQGSTTVCSNSFVTLTAAPSGSTYKWNTSATTPSITAASAGTYSVTVTNSTYCLTSNTASKTLTSATAPAPSIVVSYNYLCSTFNSKTAGLATQAADTYHWSTGGTQQTTTANATGNYTLTVTKNGCSATTSRSIDCYTAVASSIEGVEILDEEDLLDDTRISIFPNPADETLKVFLPTYVKRADIELFNEWGVSVYQLQERFEQRAHGIPTHNLTPGIYLLQIRTNGGSYTKKILVKH